MYNQQRGFLPLTTKLLGMIILVYSIAAGLISLVDKSIKALAEHRPLTDIMLASVATLLILAIPIWWSLILVKAFPAVRVVQNGIRYSSLSFIRGLIRWSEIEGVLVFENDNVAVAFRKPGFYLFNGTYFNKLYGMLIRHEVAVLFLSPGTQNRESILSEIYEKSAVKKPKQVIRRA